MSDFITREEALEKADRLTTEDPCVTFAVLTEGYTPEDALTIERIETLLMADLSETDRRAIERNLKTAIARAKRTARRVAA